jgi:hypothetical protein
MRLQQPALRPRASHWESFVGAMGSLNTGSSVKNGNTEPATAGTVQLREIVLQALGKTLVLFCARLPAAQSALNQTH